MASKVLLTVDTELTWRHHRDGSSWEANFERSVEAGGVGISYQLAVLANHGLKACFFVDPMPALLFGLEPVRRMVEPILAAGQEVQLHLHPFWAELAAGEPARTFELNAVDAERQAALIATARDLLVAAGAPQPIAFRAGSYAANADTLAALARLEFRYDSSHNGCEHPWPSTISLPPAQLAPAAAGDVVEIPVGLMEESAGRLRHLQLCAVSFRELRAALVHAERNRHPLTTLVSHSFELATRDGRRANGVVQGRFLRLCRFLADRRGTLPTAWFSELEDVTIGAAATPLVNRADRRYRRIASQVWAGTRYERPADMLTAASGSGLTGAEMLLPYVG